MLNLLKFKIVSCKSKNLICNKLWTENNYALLIYHALSVSSYKFNKSSYKKIEVKYGESRFK